MIVAGNRNECWEWVGKRGKDGYPITWPFDYGRSYRSAYARWWGPIPRGFHVHHACRNKLCLNPFHLQAISPNEHRRLHGRRGG
jgi:hypothetical protein